MSVKAMMATILHNQPQLRGVHSLTPSDYEEIVELLMTRSESWSSGWLREK